MQSDALHARAFERILLIKLSAVGDVVHTIPLLNALRRRYPKARIDWLTTPAMADLLAHHPAINNVIEFTRDDWRAPWRATPFINAARLIGRLRAARYDLVLDLQGQFRSGVLAFASGAPVRIGFARPDPALWRALPRKTPDEARKHAWQGAREGSWLAYTHTIDLPTLDLHPVDRTLRVAPLLGLGEPPADFSFPIPRDAATRITALLDYYGIGQSNFIALAPATNWDTKEWRAEGFAEVARHFLQKNSAVALIGSARERERCEQIAALAPGAVNLAGETTLSELAALLARAAVCVSNDSGPMHLAVALGRPVVGIFGPTDPVWAGPYRRERAVVRLDLPCAPCYLRRVADCPNGHACMENLAAGAVIERVAAMLAA